MLFLARRDIPPPPLAKVAWARRISLSHCGTCGREDAFAHSIVYTQTRRSTDIQRSLYG